MPTRRGYFLRRCTSSILRIAPRQRLSDSSKLSIKHPVPAIVQLIDKLRSPMMCQNKEIFQKIKNYRDKMDVDGHMKYLDKVL